MRGDKKSGPESEPVIDEMMEMVNKRAAEGCVATSGDSQAAAGTEGQGQGRFWRAVIHTQLHRQPALVHSLGGLDFIPAQAADLAPFGSYFREKRFVDLCRLLPPVSAAWLC